MPTQVRWTGQGLPPAFHCLLGLLWIAAGCTTVEIAGRDESHLQADSASGGDSSENGPAAIQLTSYRQPPEEDSASGQPESGPALDAAVPPPEHLGPGASPQPGEGAIIDPLQFATDLFGGGHHLPPVEEPTPDRYPLDLMTALRLGGANHLQIQLAAERVHEAHARLEGAEALWIPNLSAGIQYNRHDGTLQDTRGQVLDVSRQSLYVGGGPFVGDMAPLSGGASGPARLFVDLSLADVFFEPLAERQATKAVRGDEAVVYNDSLLDVTLVYLELVRAQMQVTIAEEAVGNAEELAEITEEFARTGIGLEADAQRALAELADRRRDLHAAKERVHVVSAELARQLRLSQDVVLYAAESRPLPLTIVAEDVPLEELIAQGLTHRPELARHQGLVAESVERLRQEKWRPWLPHLFVGYAGAGFGGGPGSHFGNFRGRGDFDALAIWEVRNLGLGNRALQRERASQQRQANLAFHQVRDLIAAEVTQAHHQVRYRREQIEQAERQVQAAAEALPLNFEGIRGVVLRPIEAQQAIDALAAARNLYLAAVIDYNRAQFELLRALGQAPDLPLLSEKVEGPFNEPVN